MWAAASSRAQGTASANIPQARPVLVWLTAVTNGDQDQLKTVFSESMRQQFDQEGWAKVLATYQDGFRNAFGEYKLEDFRFEYTGGEDAGYVTVTHRGKTMPALRVVRERTDWKVGER